MLQEPGRQEFRLLLGHEVAALGDDTTLDVVGDLAERDLGLMSAAAGLGARTAERRPGRLLERLSGALLTGRDGMRMDSRAARCGARSVNVAAAVHVDLAVRLQLFALAHNLANFLRTLALPDAVAEWLLTTSRERLIKVGVRTVRHGRYLAFQLAEVAVPRAPLAAILRRMDRLRPRPSLPA